MLAAAWCACAILPVGVLGATAVAMGEDAQPTPVSTSDRWFNPECEYLEYEKRQAKAWFHSFVHRMATGLLNYPEVMRLLDNPVFKELCKAITDSNFSDINSARSSVFELLSEYPELYKHVLGPYEDPILALNMYKFFTGKNPAPPSPRGGLVPEYREFIDKIESIFRDVKDDRDTEKFSYEYLIAHEKSNRLFNIITVLVIRSDWKLEEIGHELDKLYEAVHVTCYTKTLYEKLVEPLVLTLCSVNFFGHGAHCKAFLVKLLELGIKFNTIADIKFFKWGEMDPVSRHYLVEALAEVCKRYARPGLPDTPALPAWCYRHRNLLREHPDNIFAALWHSYSRRAEAYCSFADSVKYMFLRKRARDPFIPDLPPQIGYLLLYFLKSEALRTTYSESDQQTVRDKFFAKLSSKKLAAVLCLEALDEESGEEYLRKQLVRLSIGCRTLLTIEVSRREAMKYIYSGTDLFDELAINDQLMMISQILVEIDGDV
ncbi:hypothetical protein PAPHI01_1383 [Pancytospora philotis]|nr:hypothetical protein PAPHI01_1383 [Pancytospora philotis]